MELPKWKYTDCDGEAVDVDKIPSKAIGFVYIVNFTDGTSYAGKKLCRTTELKPVLRNGNARKNHIRFLTKIKKHKKVPYEELSKELDWANYIGSFDQAEFKSNDVESREIISFHSTKKGMTYAEMSMLFKFNVLTLQSSFRNRNIQGTLFSSDVESVDCMD